MKKSITISALVVLALIAVALVGYGSRSTAPDLNVTEDTVIAPQATGATVQIGEAKAKEVPISPGLTALDATRQVAEVAVQGEGEAAFVTAINGQQPDEEQRQFWSFIVNDLPAEVGAGVYQVQPGDRISWLIDTY